MQNDFDSIKPPGGQLISPSAPRLNKSKLAPPPRPLDTVVRHRLIQQVADAEQPVILLMAPAGFGKTFVMSQAMEALAARSHSVAWLSLEERDNDFSRFYTYLREAINGLGLFDWSSSSRSTNAVENSFSDLRAESFELIDAIASNQSPFALFLDDFEAIQSSEVISFFNELLRSLNPGQRIVIGSRSMRTLPLSSFELSGRVLRIEADSLSFDIGETAQFFFGEHSQQHLSADEVARLREKTEGWAAALRLVKLAFPGHDDLESWLARFANRSEGIAQYLAENVLSKLPKQTLNFLLRTSILDTLDGNLCDAVLESRDSSQVLAELLRANLFVSLVDPAWPSYQYHSLFRRFLQTELERTHPEEVNFLHRKAAVFLCSHGRYYEAFQHAVFSEDNELAVDIIDLFVLRLVDLGQLETVTKWIDALPREQIADHPDIQRARAYTMISMHRYAEAEDALNQLQRIATEQGGDLDAEAVMQRVLLHEWMDRYDLAEREIPRMLKQVQPEDFQAFGTTRNLMAQHAIATMDHEAALCHLSAAKATYKDPAQEGGWAPTYSTCFEGVVEMLTGNSRGATQRFELALERATGSVKLVPAAYLADALYAKGDIARAGAIAESYLRLSQTVAPADLVILAFRTAARVNFLNGNLDGTEALLTQLGDIGDMRDVSRLKAAAWLEKSRIALLCGNPEIAARYCSLGSSPRIWEVFGDARYYPHELDDAVIASIRMDLVLGDAETAVCRLESEIAKTTATNRILRRLRLQCLLAQAHWRTRRQRQAIEVLESALQLAAPNELVYTFADEPWCLLPILEEIARSRTRLDRQFLDRVIAATSLVASRIGNLTVAKQQKDVLTLKETAILTLVAEGKANKEIARILNISDNTVETHLRKINQKFETKNRTQAVTKAREQGLIR